MMTPVRHSIKAAVFTFWAAMFAMLPVQSFAHDDVVIYNVFARESFGAEGTVFFTIQNNSKTDAVIVGADSYVSKSVEMRNHVAKDGVVEMRKIDKMVIAPGQTLQLIPGGPHMVLMNLREPIKKGDEIIVNVHFADKTTKSLVVVVQGPAFQIN